MNLSEVFSNIQPIILGIVTFVVCNILQKIFEAIKAQFTNISIYKVWNESGIEYMYDNQADAMDDMLKKADESNSISVFANYADIFSFDNQQMLSLLNDKDKSQNIRFLVLDPDSDAADYWEAETPGYINRISSAIVTYKANEKIELATHDVQSRLRVYIFDNIMYLGFRLKMKDKETNKICSDLPIWKIGEDSYLYKAFMQQFEDLWCKIEKKKRLISNGKLVINTRNEELTTSELTETFMAAQNGDANAQCRLAFIT